MNEDINNLDEHKQLYELKIELQNEINKEKWKFIYFNS